MKAKQTVTYTHRSPISGDPEALLRISSHARYRSGGDTESDGERRCDGVLDNVLAEALLVGDIAPKSPEVFRPLVRGPDSACLLVTSAGSSPGDTYPTTVGVRIPIRCSESLGILLRWTLMMGVAVTARLPSHDAARA